MKRIAKDSKDFDIMGDWKKEANAEVNNENKGQNNKRSLKEITYSLSSKDEEVDNISKEKNEKSSGRRDVEDNIWDEELHRDFVSCIFDFGLKHCSPLLVSENMKCSVKSASSPKGSDYQDKKDNNNNEKNNGLTLERIKSHLQKYRMNKTRSKTEFMNHYDAALETLQNVMCGKLLLSNSHSNNYNLDSSENHDRIEKLMIHSLPNLLLPSTIKSLSSGDVAAYLSYTIMVTDKMKKQEQENSKAIEKDNRNKTDKVKFNKRHKGTQHSNLHDKNQENNFNNRSIHNIKEDASSKKLLERVYEEELKSKNTNLDLPILTPEEKTSPIGIAFDFFVPLFHEVRRQLMHSRALASPSKNDLTTAADKIQSSQFQPLNHHTTHPTLQTTSQNITANQMNNRMNLASQMLLGTTSFPSHNHNDPKITRAPHQDPTNFKTQLHTSFQEQYHANTNVKSLPHIAQTNHQLGHQAAITNIPNNSPKSNNINYKQVLHAQSHTPPPNNMNATSNNLYRNHNTQVRHDQQTTYPSMYPKNGPTPLPPPSHHTNTDPGIPHSTQQTHQQQLNIGSRPTVLNAQNISLGDTSKPLRTSVVIYSDPAKAQMNQPSQHNSVTYNRTAMNSSNHVQNNNYSIDENSSHHPTLSPQKYYERR